jgi:predicted GNAT family acetyltransferase
MEVVQLSDPNEFLERAARLLLADEARHNLILGLAGTLRDQPARYPEFRLWVVEDAGRVVAAALRTPPHRLVLAQPETAAALPALAEGLDDLPGVVGGAPEAREFADAWTAKTGAVAQVDSEQGVYALDRLERARAADGAHRRAGERDRELLLDWLGAFSTEALGEEADDAELQRMIDLRVTGDRDYGFVLWEDEGRPVSVTGFGSPTPTGIRIGPVYTPPELRGHGYASALVAEVSQAQLGAGRRFCFLYTDLANPTSNRIYVDLGYKRVCDSLQLSFHPA